MVCERKNGVCKGVYGYDAQADDIQTQIDRLNTRRAALVSQLETETITDEHIQSVAETLALADTSALIDKAEHSFEARRGLVAFLNLRATLRVDEAGDKWVDIHWLIRTYPRRIGDKSDDGSPPNEEASSYVTKQNTGAPVI